MKTKLNLVKRVMAKKGYYILSDFATLKNKSKQAISKNKKAYIYIFENGREWYKFDNGNNYYKIYKEDRSLIDIFSEFGFVRKHKSLTNGINPRCDIKLLNNYGKILLTFYSDNGDTLDIISSIKNAEIQKCENLID